MRRTLAVGAAVTLALSGAAVIPAAPALAASCVYTNLTTGVQAPGTTVKKAASACHDLNLVAAWDRHSNGDYYAGYYRTSDGVWHRGSRGYLWFPNGGSLVVLVSNINTGTVMGVASFYDGPVAVQVMH